MPEVAGSVAIVEGQAAAAAQQAASYSFADSADAVDPAAAIIDDVLAGKPEATETPTEGEPAKTDEDKTPVDKPVEAKPAAEPTPEAPPPNDVEAARLRRGYAKLAEDRQKLIELQNTARAATQSAQQFAEKAGKHDAIVAALEKDPAAFLQAHGGEALVQKALQGFIDMEKSPAEREVAKVRQELADRDKAQAQRQQEESVTRWRNEGFAKIQANEKFDIVNTLGLHDKVVSVITGYYDKHSERNEKGEVVKPAVLSWEDAAQAVEDAHASALDNKSKRYGKRTPAAAETPAKKDAPPAKPAVAAAKKAPTSLSSVPVADTPSIEDDLPTNDNDERERRILAEFGI